MGRTCPDTGEGSLLVNVFLRGGADGLNLVVPHGDPDYARFRPTIGVAGPDALGGCLDLDGFFGLHPAAGALLPLWGEGQLAVVHAVGTDDASRSHFSAQDRLEHAGPEGQDVGSGWLARHLRQRATPPGPLTAVAFGDKLPEALRGAPSATVLEGLDDLPLDAAADFQEAVAVLYAEAGGLLGQAGGQTLASLERVRQLRDRVGSGLAYPEGRFGRHLEALARLVHGDVGVEVACVDLAGWDTHFVQGTLFDGLVRQLAEGLAALRRDLGEAQWRRTAVVVMSEFGRRIPENGSLGTDHGRGGAGFVLGGRIAGGRVLADWPGLAPGGVLDAHDVAVTLDARAVLADVLCATGSTRLGVAFPGLDPRPLGLVAG
jgi:uncharacterized protein (DUF1501 family)